MEDTFLSLAYLNSQQSLRCDRHFSSSKFHLPWIVSTTVSWILLFLWTFHISFHYDFLSFCMTLKCYRFSRFVLWLLSILYDCLFLILYTARSSITFSELITVKFIYLAQLSIMRCSMSNCLLVIATCTFYRHHQFNMSTKMHYISHSFL